MFNSKFIVIIIYSAARFNAVTDVINSGGDTFSITLDVWYELDAILCKMYDTYITGNRITEKMYLQAERARVSRFR